MIRRLLRAAVLVVVMVGSLAVVTTPAHAIPHAGPYESYTYTYYSNAAKTVEVGWYSYGYCGEPFDFGTHTQYFRLRHVICNPGTD